LPALRAFEVVVSGCAERTLGPTLGVRSGASSFFDSLRLLAALQTALRQVLGNAAHCGLLHFGAATPERLRRPVRWSPRIDRRLISQDAGLKIRPRRLHQNAASRKALIKRGLAFSLSARPCTKMQRNEHHPALNPAPIFDVSDSLLVQRD
jgi:hypothetical protein